MDRSLFNFFGASEREQVADAIVKLPAQGRLLDQMVGAVDRAEQAGAPAGTIEHARGLLEVARNKWETWNSICWDAYWNLVDSGDSRFDVSGVSGFAERALGVTAAAALVIAGVLLSIAGSGVLAVAAVIAGVALALATAFDWISENVVSLTAPGPGGTPSALQRAIEPAVSSVLLVALVGLGAFLFLRKRRV